jgi:hypothetical protein
VIEVRADDAVLLPQFEYCVGFFRKLTTGVEANGRGELVKIIQPALNSRTETGNKGI